MLSACYCGILKVSVPFIDSCSISTYSQLEAAIHFIQTYEPDDERMRFLTRQVELPNDKRYKSDGLATAERLRALGTSAYEHFRQVALLASTRLLRRITCQVDSISTTEYYNAIFNGLLDVQRHSDQHKAVIREQNKWQHELLRLVAGLAKFMTLLFMARATGTYRRIQASRCPTPAAASLLARMIICFMAATRV